MRPPCLRIYPRTSSGDHKIYLRSRAPQSAHCVATPKTENTFQQQAAPVSVCFVFPFFLIPSQVFLSVQVSPMFCAFTPDHRPPVSLNPAEHHIFNPVYHPRPSTGSTVWIRPLFIPSALLLLSLPTTNAIRTTDPSVHIPATVLFLSLIRCLHATAPTQQPNIVLAHHRRILACRRL